MSLVTIHIGCLLVFQVLIFSLKIALSPLPTLFLLGRALLNSKQQETHIGGVPAVSHKHVSFQQSLCCLNCCFSASSTMELSYSLKEGGGG